MKFEMDDKHYEQALERIEVMAARIATLEAELAERDARWEELRGWCEREHGEWGRGSGELNAFVEDLLDHMDTHPPGDVVSGTIADVHVDRDGDFIGIETDKPTEGWGPEDKVYLVGRGDHA